MKAQNRGARFSAQGELSEAAVSQNDWGGGHEREVAHAHRRNQMRRARIASRFPPRFLFPPTPKHKRAAVRKQGEAEVPEVQTDSCDFWGFSKARGQRCWWAAMEPIRVLVLLVLAVSISATNLASAPADDEWKSDLAASAKLIAKARGERGAVFKAQALADSDEGKAEALLAKAKMISGKLRAIRAAAEKENEEEEEEAAVRRREARGAEEKKRLAAGDRAQREARAMRFAEGDIERHFGRDALVTGGDGGGEEGMAKAAVAEVLEGERVRMSDVDGGDSLSNDGGEEGGRQRAQRILAQDELDAQRAGIVGPASHSSLSRFGRRRRRRSSSSRTVLHSYSSSSHREHQRGLGEASAALLEDSIERAFAAGEREAVRSSEIPKGGLH